MTISYETICKAVKRIQSVIEFNHSLPHHIEYKSSLKTQHSSYECLIDSFDGEYLSILDLSACSRNKLDVDVLIKLYASYSNPNVSFSSYLSMNGVNIEPIHLKLHNKSIVSIKGCYAIEKPKQQINKVRRKKRKDK